ncbi:MAG: bifunctional diguanylate cyclase/phosphodiesterase [Cypionkella sp.]|jgi:diguanylate cyclase
MSSGHLSQIATRMRRTGRGLRRPEVLVFLPAIAMIAFWLGGEKPLIGLALLAPLIFVLTARAAPQRSALASSDVLEGLSLRSQLVTALDTTLADAEMTGLNTACLIVQLDHADRIVDRFGRAAQTRAVTCVAERICAVLRPGDLVARQESTGFSIALAPARRVDLEVLVQMAARLQAAVSAPISLDAAKIYVSCSVGFCHGARAPAPSGESLLAAAQAAADEARRQGPSGIRAYSPEMARVRADRACLRDDLEHALDEGQIRPHFQPQISTDTGEITGFEALARWYHPEKGLIAPADFLPLLDDLGLEGRLCEVMVYQSLLALSRWDRAGLKVPTVAVNFSGQELRDPKLVDKLKWELDRFDLAASRLTVEVLENVVAATENDVVIANIAALAKLGCGVDLDDFGTGHASITSIRRFAIRRIKIDRSFVTRLDEDREQQKMVAAILSMAEQLGLATLAEGVETPGEHAMLAQLGCGDVQGFGIARPMPVDETFDWIGRHRAQLTKMPNIVTQRR